MAARTAAAEALPESDRLDDCPHPRETFDLIGQSEAEQDLLNAYRQNALPQAIILSGQAGIGKATLAWRIARFLLAHPDPKAAFVQAAPDLHVPLDHPVSRTLADRDATLKVCPCDKFRTKLGKLHFYSTFAA